MMTESEGDGSRQCRCCCKLAWRYVVIFLCSMGMCISHAMRTELAVTVVTILDEEPHKKVGTIEAIINLPDVEWSSAEVGFLHSVFYIGFIVTQIPGGYLATKLPSHRLFGISIALSCLLNLLLPVSIDLLTYSVTCVIRLFQGLSEGLLMPCAYAVMRHWTTPQERGRMGAMVLTGLYLGPVIGLPMAGYLTHYYGWQLIYYVWGGVGLVWFLIWIFLTYETPEEHPFISKEELGLIHERQGETAIVYENEQIPWKAILTSMPVHALNVCNFARSFIFFLLLTNEPTYLNVFDFSIAENGLYSALPHILMTTIALLSGPMADWLIQDTQLTPTHVRKMFTGIGFGAEVAFLSTLVFIRDGTSALIFLTIGVGLSGLTISGWQINHLDLAPRYASVLVGITTTSGVVAGIINPIIVGALTPDQNVDEWHRVFLLVILILTVAIIFYSIFGSGEKQPWAEPLDTGVPLIKKKKVPTATLR